MWVTKLLISPVKKKDFLPKNDQILPKIGIFGHFGPGHAGLFGALLVGWLVVVARGLYLATFSNRGQNMVRVKKWDSFFGHARFARALDNSAQ